MATTGSMEAEMKYLKIARPGLGSYTCGINSAMTELEESWEAGEVGDTVSFEIVEMSEAEHAALPEFMGW